MTSRRSSRFSKTFDDWIKDPKSWKDFGANIQDVTHDIAAIGRAIKVVLEDAKAFDEWIGKDYGVHNFMPGGGKPGRGAFGYPGDLAAGAEGVLTGIRTRQRTGATRGDPQEHLYRSGTRPDAVLRAVAIFARQRPARRPVEHCRTARRPQCAGIRPIQQSRCAMAERSSRSASGKTTSAISAATISSPAFRRPSRAPLPTWRC